MLLLSERCMLLLLSGVQSPGVLLQLACVLAGVWSLTGAGDGDRCGARGGDR
jgi:hypothetical protein